MASTAGVKPRAITTAFNQDGSCCVVASDHGFTICSLEPWARIYSHPNGAYKIVQMLFSTSLIALVGLGDQPSLSPRRLQIFNTKRRSMICELTFPMSILALQMNRKRLAVVLERQIYLYDISNMRLLHTIETPMNQLAVCALSPSAEKSILCYPAQVSGLTDAVHAPPKSASIVSGDVLIYDTLNCQPINVLEAHRASLAMLQVNHTGELLATASEKGTIIRIFSLPEGSRLWELRRGSLPARITSIAFDSLSAYVAVSSNSETVHVFRLQADGSEAADANRPPGPPRRTSRGALGLIRRSSQSLGRSMAGTFAPFLPASVSDIWQPARHFASVKLDSKSEKTLTTLSGEHMHLHVLTDAGLLQRYSLNQRHGGDCELVSQIDLLSQAEERRIEA
ncbi:autophagy protein [Savitreella phatthalungensis]